MKTPIIGFIGQGWIGKNYADDFENRGFTVVRYSLDKEYIKNAAKIKDCDIVFIAVPTPTNIKGFDFSLIESVIKLVGAGKIAVIKSTLVPGTTEKIQKQNKKIFVLHSPEFLTEATAAYDAAHPNRNILGVPVDNKKYKEKAREVLNILPRAAVTIICKAREAELIKYGGNNWFYLKVVFVNMIYDLAQANGCNYEVIREAMSADYRIGKSHLMPVHKSGTLGSDNYDLISTKQVRGGRGAGGHCFIKDYAAFVKVYEEMVPKDKSGLQMLKAIEEKNIELLLESRKDLDLLSGVYGPSILNKKK
jgi:UDP-glucose 6-dehydrogenase